MDQNATTTGPRLGIAYGVGTPAFLRDHPEAIDYVEVPYELLRHDPSVLEVACVKPLVLHCASLSIAGTVLPSRETVADVRRLIGQTATPWLGEHLSFITAERPGDAFSADEYAPGEPYNIGYTVSPPMNPETVEIVVGALDRYHDTFDVPLLVENPPLYLATPGSSLSQTEFIGRVCERSPVRLLLDLAHFYITSRNMGFDPRREVLRLPLERVDEVHISGVLCEAGVSWDSHATRTPEAILELLAIVLRRASVRAITLEYNWSGRFPAATLLDEIGRVRRTLAGVT